MTNKFKIKIAAGFTLIETLVAVVILATAIAGPLTIASKGLSAALVAKNQTTAEFLAQDAVEYVRFVRDSNRLTNKSWLTRLNSCTSADGTASCIIDSLADSVTVCSATCPKFIFQGASAASPFIRTVSIQSPIGSNDCTAGKGCEAIVKVVVTWQDSVNTRNSHKVTVIENLLDWQ